jgi:hypothetical protein
VVDLDLSRPTGHILREELDFQNTAAPDSPFSASDVVAHGLMRI